MKRLLQRVMLPTAIIGLMTVAGGCTTYVDRYNYNPQPAELTYNAKQTGASPDARALVSIVGIRRKAAEGMDRPGVDVKVRVENLSRSDVRFDPEAMAVITGALERLESPVSPAEPTTLTQGESTVSLLSFPLPAGTGAGDESVDGFNVRLTLEIADQRITQSIGFQRRRDMDDRYYYHPYHAYPYGPYYDRYHGGFFYHD